MATSGTHISLTSHQVSITVTEFTENGIPMPGSGTTTTRCCSTPTRSALMANSTGMPRASPTTLMTPTQQTRRIRRHSFHSVLSTTVPLTGAAMNYSKPQPTRASSTRPMSEGSRCSTPTSLQRNGAPTPPCVILRSLNISYSSELLRSN